MFEAAWLVLFLYVWGSWAAFAIEFWLFHRWVVAQGIKIPSLWSPLPPNALSAYHRWCAEKDRPPDRARLNRYRRFRYNTLASFVAFIGLFVLEVVRQRSLD